MPAFRMAYFPALIAASLGIANGATFPGGVKGQRFYDTDSIRFASPVWVGPFPGVSGALMVGEGAGGLQVLEPEGNGYRKWTFGSVSAAFFSGNDGLLGLAFHPDFAANGRYFVCYNPVRGRLLLEERQAAPDRRADAGSAKTLLQVELGGVVHQGGDIHFGPDGYLYLGIGDGGNPNVYNTRSRDSSQLFGKMLRIDVDRADPGIPYGIPPDNPMASAGGATRREIWASGLRQPWRFSFDVDGALIVGDVGDWVEEEVDVIRKGGDYGWSRMEGTTCFNKDLETAPLGACDTAGLIPPAAVLPHVPVSTEATACLIGGYVFRGDPESPFYGAYVFGDYETRMLYAVRLADHPAGPPEPIGNVPTPMSTFGMDRPGNLYVAGYVDGIIYRLSHPGLAGKGVAIQRRPSRAARPGLVRRRLTASDFPGARSVSLLSPAGRVLRRYPAAILAAGTAPDLPPGLYIAQSQSASGTRSALFLMP